MSSMKQSFRGYILNESYKNLFKSKEKEQYKNEVFNILQKSYEKIGGLGGSGFRSADDMVKNIPFWKLAFKDGELVACVLYKDTSGRKLVAIGSIVPAGKKAIKEILAIEFTRSYAEISGPLLKYMEYKFPDILKKYSIKSNKVQDIIKKEIEIVDDYYYIRKIGREKHKKIMLGTIGKSIY